MSGNNSGMRYISEAARRTPVAADCDVLVLGAGPAGFSAAVCAARQGAKTVLMEQAGDVGGVATAGLMSHWTGRTEGGFYEEILDRSLDVDAGQKTDRVSRRVINPEVLKTALLEMLDEAGVRLRLYTMACEPVMDGQAVRGVIAESKSGRQAFLAKVVIDATGDGDIAARAGVPYQKGREADGRMQPMTLMFKVAGVDTARALFPGSFESSTEVPAGTLQALAKRHLPQPAGHVLLYKSTLPDVVTCNMTNCVDVDGTNADDLTRATLVCRRQMNGIVAFLKKFVPGYEQCFIISTASLIGVRETRHFMGEKQLTEEDILSARQFDDWVVERALFNFDVHSLTGSGLDETGQQQKFPQTAHYTIPYGCLVPQKVDNLLLAGRNISGTHLAHSNYRVMPICANTGQAAGIAAAISAREGILPRDVDVKKIQAVVKQGSL